MHGRPASSDATRPASPRASSTRPPRRSWNRCLPAWDAERRGRSPRGLRRDASPRWASPGSTTRATSAMTPGSTGPALYRGLAADGRLPLRVTARCASRSCRPRIDAGMRTGAGEGRYRDGWLKLFADGALGSRSAALLAPYEADDPAGRPVGGPTGMLTRDPERCCLALACGPRQAASRSRSTASATRRCGSRSTSSRQLPRVGGARPPGGACAARRPRRRAALRRARRRRVGPALSPVHRRARHRRGLGDATAQRLPARVARPRRVPSSRSGTDAPVESPDPWRNLAAAVSPGDPGWPARDRALPSGAGAARRPRAAGRVPRPGHHRGPARPRAALGRSAAPTWWSCRSRASSTRARAARASRRPGPLATLIDGEVVHLASGYRPGRLTQRLDRPAEAALHGPSPAAHQSVPLALAIVGSNRRSSAQVASTSSGPTRSRRPARPGRPPPPRSSR